MVIRWLCLMCGGDFFRAESQEKMNITAEVGRVNKAAGTLVQHLLSALADGTVDPNERTRIVRDLREMRAVVESALLVAEQGGRA